ncbi:hypothetical protein GN956_G16413 [Arapaima gigas]
MHCPRLESACAALHWRGAGSWVALAAHNGSALSPHALLAHFRAFSLSFCDSYTVSDLLLGAAEPDNLNCSLQNMVWALASGGVALDDDEDVCGSCIQAYMRLDQHAQEKYEEFELLFLKYLSEDYSVRSRLEDCKVRTLAHLLRTIKAHFLHGIEIGFETTRNSERWSMYGLAVEAA